MFNKFNPSGAFSPPSESPAVTTPDPTTSDLSCVVATNGVWKLSDCDELHGVVCQSDEELPGNIFGTVSYCVYSHFSCHATVSLVRDACLVFANDVIGLFISFFIIFSSCSLFVADYIANKVA